MTIKEVLLLFVVLAIIVSASIIFAWIEHKEDMQNWEQSFKHKDWEDK